MYDSLPCQRLLVGVSGSLHASQITSYLVPLRRQFSKEIRVIMTPTAAEMVPPRTVELVTDGPVLTSIWGQGQDQSPHIRLTRWAELFVVLPASANIIGKVANGIADDLLSTAILASAEPVIFAPAMNPTMWASKSVTRNVATLREDGHYVVNPGEITSLTTGDLDTGLGPTPASLLPHIWHVHFRRLRQRVWEEATAQQPVTPAAERSLQKAAPTLIPVSALFTGPTN